MEKISNNSVPTKSVIMDKIRAHYSEEELSTPITNLSINDFRMAQTENMGSYKATTYYHDTWTIDEFSNMVYSLACSLEKMGIQKGEYVAVSSFGSIEEKVTFYALTSLQAIPVQIDPRTNAKAIEEILKMDNCRFMFMIDAAYGKIRKLVDKVPLQKIISITPLTWMNQKERIQYTVYQKLKGHNIDIPKNDIGYVQWTDLLTYGANYVVKPTGEFSPDDIATIIFTSGTTGPKKGVEITHKNINAVTQMYQQSDMDFRAGDTLINIMPPFIGYGAVFSHLAYCSGVENLIIPFSNSSVMNEIILEKGDARLHVVGVPNHFLGWPTNPKMKAANLSNVQTIAMGGAPCSSPKERQFNEFSVSHNGPRAVKGYSASEVTSAGVTTYNNGNPIFNKIGSVGLLLPLNDLKIVDKNEGERFLPNEIGEFWISGPTVVKGYHRQEEETRQSFIDGYFHTGDLGYVDDDGMIFLLAREKNMIIRPDGHNVFPGEIDKIISEHPKVKECITVGVPSRLDIVGDLPMSFIVLEKGNSFYDLLYKKKIVVELRKMTLDNLPERDVPSFYQIMDKIPYTDVGKPDIIALETIAKQRKILKKW